MASEVIVDDELTGWENLEIQAKLIGVKNWKECFSLWYYTFLESPYSSINLHSSFSGIRNNGY